MKYTDDELLTALQTLADEKGRPPTGKEANAHPDSPSKSTFLRRFGSWNNALCEAGLDRNLLRLSDEELITDLQRLSNTLGKCPTIADVNNADDMASAGTYKYRFESWNNALDAANLLPKHRQISKK
jgi:hypothetical protein